MIKNLLHKSPADSAEARLQRKALALLFITAAISAISDGWLDPPDDGGWHIGTAICGVLGCMTTSVGFVLTRYGYVYFSGWIFIISMALIGTATFITGTVSSVLISTVGLFCLAMVLPPNIFPNLSVVESRAWPATFISLYVGSMVLRILVRHGDVISYPSELPFLLVAGPIFIYLVYEMGQRSSTRLKSALKESELARAEVDTINTRLWQRSTDLSEALDAANLASAAKGRFLANMSHELRTPLNAILGYAAIVQEELEDVPPGGEIPAHVRQDLNHIETAGQHLLGLISDVLDLARIEAGQSALDIELIDIHALFDEFRLIMRPEALKRGNTLNVETSKGLSMYSDLIKLRQIIFNLLGNATKFTDKGTITLRATLRDDAKILFEVEDTGKGIPQDKQAKLFEPFEQVDSSSTRVHGGAGLGLALCTQLVELLGGTISLSSEMGKGSTFAFALPVAPEQVSPLATTPQAETKAQTKQRE